MPATLRLTDYKISRLTRHDDGSMTVFVRFYETNQLRPFEWPPKPEVQYLKRTLWRERTYKLNNLSDGGLRRYLNAILARSATHQPVEWQRNA